MVKKIMWDPGHGGTDPGAVGNGLQEEDLTVRIVQYAMAYLSAHYTGFEQRQTRGPEQTLPLGNRDDAADAWGADVFVSVHINSGGGTGFESYIYTSAGGTTVTLQNILHAEILATMQTFGIIRDRGKKRANFSVLRETNMPAVLTENLFIDSNDANNFLKRADFLNAVGEAHARGVAQYLGLPQKLPSVVYEAHVENIGWQGWRRDGETAGTTGQSLRLEALRVNFENSSASLQIEAHVQDRGWLPARTNGENVGTVGEKLRMEAIKITANGLNITYRVHLQGIGWTSWVANGEVAGTIGESRRLEAIEIRIV